MSGADAKLLGELAGFGYAASSQRPENPEILLAKISQSADARVLEGFPVVLANALLREGPRVRLAQAQALLQPAARARFRDLAAISFHLFESFGLGALRFQCDPDRLFGDARGLSEALTRKKAVTLSGGGSLEAERLEKAFQQSVAAAADARRRAADEKATLSEELRQEYNLSLLLSPKQKDLLWKRLRGTAMTKTEREYFSRVVRKKLAALADPELQGLALKALNA